MNKKLKAIMNFHTRADEYEFANEYISVLKKIGLKNIRRRYLASRILFFALNSQSDWLLFVYFVNIYRFFEV